MPSYDCVGELFKQSNFFSLYLLPNCPCLTSVLDSLSIHVSINENYGHIQNSNSCFAICTRFYKGIEGK